MAHIITRAVPYRMTSLPLARFGATFTHFVGHPGFHAPPPKEEAGAERFWFDLNDSRGYEA